MLTSTNNPTLRRLGMWLFGLMALIVGVNNTTAVTPQLDNDPATGEIPIIQMADDFGGDDSPTIVLPAIQAAQDLPPGQVKTAQVVETPVQTVAEATYTIKRGDTYGKIAAQQGCPNWQVLQTRNGTAPTKLRIGQDIVLPNECKGNLASQQGNAPNAVPASNRTPAPADNNDAPANTGGGSSNGQRLLEVAKTKLGKPYVWGAQGPNSFDCSGLTSWAAKQIGIGIPRNSAAQESVGHPVSKSELQPGDLVFFSSRGLRIGHVGIYAGDGQVLQAYTSGKPVAYLPLDKSGPFTSARRL